MLNLGKLSARTRERNHGFPGSVSRTAVLTWVRFDVVHLVEIFRDEKLLRANTQKPQIKHRPDRGLFKGV